jgi:hypothetical protein
VAGSARHQRIRSVRAGTQLISPPLVPAVTTPRESTWSGAIAPLFLPACVYPVAMLGWPGGILHTPAKCNARAETCLAHWQTPTPVGAQRRNVRLVASGERNIRSHLWIFAGEENMRQTIIVIATTALVTAFIAIWGTTVIIAHTQKQPDEAKAPVDMMQLMRDAMSLVDENAAPVD